VNHSPPLPNHEPIVHVPLLDLLLHVQDPVSIESLAIRIDLPAIQITRKIEQLRQAGCQIESHPQHGVRLTTSGLATWADYLQWSSTSHNPRIIEVYAQTTSTQDAARRMIDGSGNSADGAIAIADCQTAGRGRMGRRWVAPAGTAVTFTRVCLLRPSQSIDQLTLATTVALTNTLEPLANQARVQIKWPNDLLLDGRKVAGILIETFRVSGTPDRIAALIGVGINVTLNPQELPPETPIDRDRVTSLCLEGASVDRLRILADCLRHLDQTLGETDPTFMLEQWRSHCPMLSGKLKLRSGDRTICGQVIDLDPADGLIVRCDTGAVVHLPAATATILEFE